MQEKENRFFSCNSCTTPCAFNTTILSLKTSHCPPANLIGFNCNVLTMTPARQKSTDNNMTRRARQRGDVVIALLATSGVGKSDSDSSCSVRDRPPDLWPRSCWYGWWWRCCLCWWWCWCWCWYLCWSRWCRSRADPFSIVRRIRDPRPGFTDLPTHPVDSHPPVVGIQKRVRQN